MAILGDMQAHYARATQVLETGTARRYAASFRTSMTVTRGLVVFVPFLVWVDIPEVEYGTCVEVPRSLIHQASTISETIKTQGEV